VGADGLLPLLLSGSSGAPLACKEGEDIAPKILHGDIPATQAPQEMDPAPALAPAPTLTAQQNQLREYHMVLLRRGAVRIIAHVTKHHGFLLAACLRAFVELYGSRFLLVARGLDCNHGSLQMAAIYSLACKACGRELDDPKISDLIWGNSSDKELFEAESCVLRAVGFAGPRGLFPCF
jgi:hypothetical protein